MKKEIETQGIVLKIYPSQESHQTVILATPTGILKIISYGTQKSQKKSALFTLLIANFSLNSSKGEYWRVKEFQSQSTYNQINNNLEKFFTANLACELILKTYCLEKTFFLLKEFLKTLNDSSEKESSYLLISFLWRWLVLNGEEYTTTHCLDCHSDLYYEKSVFISLDDGFYCPICSLSTNNITFEFNKGMIKYLEFITKKPLKEGLSRKMDRQSKKKLLAYLYQKIQKSLGFTLKSWEFIKLPEVKKEF